jgi:hypothetical protein
MRTVLQKRVRLGEIIGGVLWFAERFSEYPYMTLEVEPKTSEIFVIITGSETFLIKCRYDYWLLGCFMSAID